MDTQTPTARPMTGEALIGRLTLTLATAPYTWRRHNYERAQVSKEELIALIRQEDATYRDADDPMRWWWKGDTIWRQRPGMSGPRQFVSAVDEL